MTVGITSVETMGEKILQWYDALIVFGFYALIGALAMGLIVFLVEIYRGSKLKSMAQREKEHGEFQEGLGEDYEHD